MAIKFQSAVLFVRDIQTSRHFYESLLGQKVLMDHGLNVGYEGGFAIWQIDHAYQMMFEHPAEGINRIGADNLELYFESDDLGSVWERLSGEDIMVLHDLREQPWGQRVLRVYDPDGHIVEVGEPMSVVVLRFSGEGMTPDQIAARTFMPLEIIQQIIAGR